jgi:hypothetical protein
VEKAKWIFMSGTLVLAACAGTPSGHHTASRQSAQDTQRSVASDSDMKDPNRIVCRVHKKIGSHFNVKDCRTAREWAEQRAENRRTMQTHQHGGKSGDGG